MTGPQQPEPPILQKTPGLPKTAQALPTQGQAFAEQMLEQPNLVNVTALPSVRGKKPWKFKVPSSARGEGDPSRFAIRELSSDEQIEASRLAFGDRTRLGTESTKMSLYAVSYDPPEVSAPTWRIINHANQEQDTLWSKMSAKVRQLAMLGYSRVHNSSDAEDAEFLGSMQAD